MDEEMEYAEMLEIPVSTVNVTKKKTRKGKKTSDLKEQVITKVNVDTTATAQSVPPNQPTEHPSQYTDSPSQSTPVLEEQPYSGLSENLIVTESSPIAIPRRKKQAFFTKIFGDRKENRSDTDADTQTNQETLSTTEPDTLPIYNYNLWNKQGNTQQESRENRHSLIVAIEFAACFALCLGIFLTNVFMPGSAINTFFRSIHQTEEPVDTRTYADFTLSSILSEENAELTLSETGILSFTEAGCVYPAADGTVDTITQNSDGTWTVKIIHSATFSEVISGLNYVSCSVGNAVKANIPLGYTDGNTEVQVSMYDSGALLNCFYVTESGNLAWSEE